MENQINKVETLQIILKTINNHKMLLTFNISHS